MDHASRPWLRNDHDGRPSFSDRLRRPGRQQGRSRRLSGSTSGIVSGLLPQVGRTRAELPFNLTGRPTNYDSGLSNGFSHDSLTPFPLVRPFVDDTGTLQNNPVAVPTQYVGRVTADAQRVHPVDGALAPLRYVGPTNGRARTAICPGPILPPGTFSLDFISGCRFMRMINSVNIHDDEMEHLRPGRQRERLDPVHEYRQLPGDRRKPRRRPGAWT